MKKKNLWGMALISLVILLAGCDNHMGSYYEMPTSFRSNGERIYYTGLSANGTPLQPIGDSLFPHHMTTSCAGCHGTERQGGIRMMPFFWVKTPPLTRQSLFDGEVHDDGHGDHDVYDSATLARAIRDGLDPSGKPLDGIMPRWQISDQDMRDLLGFLQQ